MNLLFLGYAALAFAFAVAKSDELETSGLAVFAGLGLTYLAFIGG